MKRILVISLLFAAGNALGQGIASELYQYNYSFVHPAFAGSEGQKISLLRSTATYDVSLRNHKQTTSFVAYENYFEKIKSGVGITGHSRRLGTFSLSSLGISYNYRLSLGATSELITSTRVQRHFYSASTDFIRFIDSSDPIRNTNLSAANWAADLGAMLKVKKFYFGLVANNLVHSNNAGDVIGVPTQLGENYAGILGGTFVLGEHLASEHSLYVPFDDEGYRVDLNNTLIIRDLFLVGLSVERSGEKLFVRSNAGLKVKDYFQILFLIHSEKRDLFMTPEFRGELFMGFRF